jgi:hypothetical protein
VSKATSWWPMTNIGTLVDGTLATVGSAGQISGPNVGALNWWIAADDRWHTPPNEPTCRQTRLEGTPVVETALRVPSGDVVHRAYAVVDQGGLIVVEVENQSTLPVAIAFDRPDLLTSRPPTAMAIQGIELPERSIVVPIGKGSIIRVALGQGTGSLPSTVPSAEEVMRGWLGVIDRSPRLVLPDDAVRLSVLRDRSDLLLADLPTQADPVAFLLAASELVRCRQTAEPLVDDVVVAAVAVAKLSKKTSQPGAVAALSRAAEILRRADQSQAADDVDRMRAKLALSPSLLSSPNESRPYRLARTLDGLASVQNGDLVLLADSVPSAWFGQALEVHDAPLAVGSVSFAVRWHGDRPALLWETTHLGDVRCPGLDPAWRGTGLKGEALLAAPTR